MTIGRRFPSRKAVAGHDRALPSRCQALPATERGLATVGRQSAKWLIGQRFSLPSGFGNDYTKSLICQGFSLPVTIEREDGLKGPSLSISTR